MRLPDHLPAASRLRRTAVAGVSAVVTVLALSGCRAKWSDGLLLPGKDEGAVRVRDLWVGGWLPSRSSVSSSGA